MAAYTKAPVSEVIFGVTFMSPQLELHSLFRAQQTLAEHYPISEVRVPIADEVLSGFQLQSQLNPEMTGPFLLRLKAEDRKRMCQLQANKVYVNWTRSDPEPVGQYPGYTSIAAAFEQVLVDVHLPLDSLTSDNVRFFDLTYHDRLEWEQHIPSISDAHRLMRFRPPAIGTPSGFNNVFSRYTYDYPRLGGYGIIGINTETSSTGKQLIRFENILRGVTPELPGLRWFDEAHEVQTRHFAEMFKEEILSTWR